MARPSQTFPSQTFPSQTFPSQTLASQIGELSRMLAFAWPRRHMVVLGGGLLTLCYAWAYVRYPELPGTRPAFPNGWWDWFDQSQTLRSALAFARGDLSPAQHWYPLGYAIFGAPFAWLSPVHPYLIVDLACLLIAFAAFVRFAEAAGISGDAAVALFVAASLASRQIFDQWVIPWNTTPATALLWLLLAMITSPARDPRHAFLTGVVAGCIPLFRPTDAVLVAACLGTAFAADLFGQPKRRGGDWLRIAAGATAPLAVYAGLHLSIYGPHETGYIRQSRTLGFTLSDLAWKAYVILVDPRPWFHDGDGLLRRCPWIALAIAGALPALRRNRPMAILVTMLTAHAVLYLSYVDLLPTGFWRFDNVHYWTWAMSGYAALAFILLQDLLQAGSRRELAGLCLAATALLLCVHLDPVAAPPNTPAKMLQFADIDSKFDDVYFAPITLRDDVGELSNIYGFRAVSSPSGLRLVALRRPFTGPASFPTPEEGPLAEALSHAAPPTRWAIGMTIGWPCWLPRSSCAPSPLEDLATHAKTARAND